MQQRTVRNPKFSSDSRTIHIWCIANVRPRAARTTIITPRLQRWTAGRSRTKLD